MSRKLSVLLLVYGAHTRDANGKLIMTTKPKWHWAGNVSDRTGHPGGGLDQRPNGSPALDLLESEVVFIAACSARPTRGNVNLLGAPREPALVHSGTDYVTVTS